MVRVAASVDFRHSTILLSVGQPTFTATWAQADIHTGYTSTLSRRPIWSKQQGSSRWVQGRVLLALAGGVRWFVFINKSSEYLMS